MAVATPPARVQATPPRSLRPLFRRRESRRKRAHTTISRKTRTPPRHFCSLGDDGLTGVWGRRGRGIAAARHAYRLRIDGCRAVLADYSGRTLVEAYRSANLTSIENRRNLAIRLLVQPETHLNA